MKNMKHEDGFINENTNFFDEFESKLLNFYSDASKK